MKSIRSSILAALFGLSILLAGCGLGDVATPTPTPEPISELATHAKKPDIRGKIVKVIEHEGDLPSLYIEGDIENGTFINKMFAGVETYTHIFRLMQEGYEQATVSDLVEGVRVEVLFFGEILESYPGSGKAGEILIIP